MLSKIWELIDAHTNKRSVMAAVATVWERDSWNYRRIERAYGASFAGHGQDKRRSGERYFRHILAVVIIILLYLKVHNANLIIAAFLHDLPEDKRDEWPIERVRREFGKQVAEIVEAVTRPDERFFVGNKRQLRIAIFAKITKAGRLAIILKLADRLHNMLTLWGTPEKKHEKIEETIEFVLPLAVKLGLLIEELVLAVSAQIQSKHIDDNEVSEVAHFFSIRT